VIRIVVVVTFCLLGGCGIRSAVDGAVTVEVDDFAADRYWTQDSAGDHVVFDYAPADAPGTLQAIHVASGRGHAIVRKEVAWRGDVLRALLLDCHFDGPAGCAVAIALRGAEGGWFETAPVPLSPGWNRDLRFATDDLGDGWDAQRRRVERVNLLLKPGGDGGGTVRFDALRAEVHGALWFHQPAELVSAYAPEALTRWRPATWSCTLRLPSGLDAGSDERILGDHLRTRLRLRGPDGARHEVDGYLVAHDDGTREYRCRFTPTVPGEWRARLGWDDGRTWRWEEARAFRCADAEPSAAAFVEVDPAHPRHLRYRSGGFCWPLGQNLAWAGDYRPWLAEFAAAGGDLVRIWICPWNHELWEDRALHAIDLEAASGLDAVFAAARERGIQVQLVLAYHGMLAGDWARNPFNRANGGPCHRPEDFWLDRRARAGYRRFLRYVVARWGAEPNCFAWEFFNEVNLTRRDRDRDVVDWHRAMARFLQRIDVHDHPVTTSASHADSLAGLWSLAGIDLIQVHAYTPAVDSGLHAPLALAARHRKPLFMAEFGRDHRPAGEQHDHRLVHLRQALWTSWMLPYAGSTMPWWWDTHLEPRDGVAVYAPFAAFVAGEDRRGRDLRPVTARLTGETPVRVAALVGRERAYAYLAGPDAIEEHEAAAPLGPLLAAGHRLVLEGLAAGVWTVEFWDPSRAGAGERRRIAVEGGSCAIALPEVGEDLALKLIRAGAKDPAVRLEPPP